jgi:hypothetical protein
MAAVVVQAPPAAAPITLNGKSFDFGAALGTQIGVFSGVIAGSVLTVRPNDGRVAVQGNAAGGWRLVVGATAAPVGPFTIYIKETNFKVPTAERVTAFEIRCRKVLPALPLAVGAKIQFVGHSMLQRGQFSRATGTVCQGLQECNLRSVGAWLSLLFKGCDYSNFASRVAPGAPIFPAGDTAFTGDNTNPFQSLSTTNAVNGSAQAIGGEHCQFLSVFNPGVIARLRYALDRGPAIILLHIGENDINSDGYTAAAPISSFLDEILKLIRDEGVWVILPTLQTRGYNPVKSGWPIGDVRRQILKDLNTWIVSQTGRDGVKVCDTRLLCSDDVFDPLQFNTSDEIHENSIGSYNVASVVLPVLQSMVQVGNYISVDPTVNNIFPNWGMLGTTGTKTGTGITGNVATGFVVDSKVGASTVDCFKQVISAGVSEFQGFTITPVADGTTSHSLRLHASATALIVSLGLVAGDWVEFAFRITLSAWAGWGGFSVFQEQYNVGAFIWQHNTGIIGDSSGLFPSVALDVWATGRFPVQATVDRIRIESRPFTLSWRSDQGVPSPLPVAMIGLPQWRKVGSPLPGWNL